MTAAFAVGQMMAPAAAGWAFALTGGFATPLALASALLLVTLAPLRDRE